MIERAIDRFVVTSAIVTSAGVYSPTVRLAQTMQTIRSIRQHYPKAFILLVEGGARLHDMPVGWTELRGAVDGLLDVTTDKTIVRLHELAFSVAQSPTQQGGSIGVAKTMAELVLMAGALRVLAGLPSGAQGGRVFKLSGRYQLAPLFDPRRYDTARGRYVFACRRPSWMANALEKLGIEYCLSSCLWSFDATSLAEVTAVFDAMLLNAQPGQAAHFADMEHLLFRHLGSKPLIEMPHVHVMGSVASTGVVIYE